MNTAITRSQLCWVIIRLIGVYFVYRAVIALLQVISAAAFVGSRLKLPSGDVPMGSGWAMFYTVFFTVIVPFVVGIYLLESGRMVHRCLMGEPGGFRKRKGRESVDPETTLTKKETVVFHEWLETHPEYQERARVDQIALFRDAQRETGSS